MQIFVEKYLQGQMDLLSILKFHGGTQTPAKLLRPTTCSTRLRLSSPTTGSSDVAGDCTCQALHQAPERRDIR